MGGLSLYHVRAAGIEPAMSIPGPIYPLRGMRDYRPPASQIFQHSSVRRMISSLPASSSHIEDSAQSDANVKKQGEGEKMEATTKDRKIEVTAEDLPVINAIISHGRTAEIRGRKEDIVIYEVSRKVKKVVAAAGQQ